MNEKYLLSRIAQKHDIEANWNNAADFVPMRGELIVYDIDANYDYERLKIGDGTTTVIDLPFVDENVSWNTLKDKPFGEETTVVNEPLNITWDGNTDGLVCFEAAENYAYYKVSDATPTLSELVGGSASSNRNGEGTYTEELTEQSLIDMGSVIEDSEGLFMVVHETSITIEGTTITFPATGIYFCKYNTGLTTTSLTTIEPIELTKIVIHKIEQKYLPEMTEEDAMELLAELSIVEPITNENGEVLTDETGAILSI